MSGICKIQNLTRILSAVLLAGFIAYTGCEGESNSDSSGVDEYFEANPYSSETREEPDKAELQIEPDSAAISIIGQSVEFTARGGETPYTWSVGNSTMGHVTVKGWSEGVYVCDKVGNNDVIVVDSVGHSAIAHIAPKVDTMTVSPSSVTLVSGEYYASFTVSGGTPPYTWSSGNVSLGTVSYSAGTSYLAAYTAVAGVYGKNVITVNDSEGRTASATVTQTSETPE